MRGLPIAAALLLLLLTNTQALTMSSSAPTSSSPGLSSRAVIDGGRPPPSLSELPIDQLTAQANSYAAAHGLQVESRTTALSSYQCAPISLLPNAYPSSAFSAAQSLASPFNVLVDRISRDSDFIHDTLGGDVSKADPYTGKLLELYTDIYDTTRTTKGADWGKFARTADRLGIQRSDYMLNPSAGSAGDNSGGDNKDGRQYELKQVELNTIASSFAGLAVQVAGLHGYLVERFGSGVQEWLDANEAAVMGGDNNNKAMRSSGDSSSDHQQQQRGVPTNPALKCIPSAMNVAHERYESRFCGATTDKSSCGPVVLFIVQEGETNTVDQRMLEFQLWERHRVPAVRMSLTKARAALRLDDETGALYVQPDAAESAARREVSLVYYRAGYAPTDYVQSGRNDEWAARETIERSRAAKCPCLGYHLAGTKKVQQELARPGTVERFFSEAEDEPLVERMRGAFAGLYSLGRDAAESDRAAVREAMSGGEGMYVLKPQREGGGYNYYGDKLAKKLGENVRASGEFGEALAEFILMQRLFPPRQKAILLRAGQVEGVGDSISELGVFGTIVATDDATVVHCEYAGFLLRTKFSNVDEGGVASGFATLSSPYLC